MSMGESTFGLLPEPERSPVSFVISSSVNAAILVTFVVAGMMAKQVIEQHYEMTELIVPTTPPPPSKSSHFRLRPRCRRRPSRQRWSCEPEQIEMPKPKPEPKPVQMEAKVTMPAGPAEAARSSLAPQPKAALDRGHARAEQPGEAFHGAGAPGRDFRRNPQSQRHAPGHGGCHRQSLRRQCRGRPLRRMASWDQLESETASSPAQGAGTPGKVASAGIPERNRYLKYRLETTAKWLRPEFPLLRKQLPFRSRLRIRHAAPVSKCFPSRRCSTRAKRGSCKSRAMWFCSVTFLASGKWWCRT